MHFYISNAVYSVIIQKSDISLEIQAIVLNIVMPVRRYTEFFLKPFSPLYFRKQYSF